MAKTEPNTRQQDHAGQDDPEAACRRTRPRFAASATWPATATCRLGPPLAVWAVATNCLATGVEMYCAWSSKVTVAKPVVPSALIWVEPPGP